MKFHIGTDRRGMVHRLTATHAAEADIKQLPHLLHGEERVLYGDQAYWKEADRQAFEAQGVRYPVNRRGPRGNKSFNRVLRDRCSNRWAFMSVREAQLIVESWRQEYNEERAHGALGLIPPAAYAAGIMAKERNAA